jgi:hypothetical protein
MVNVASEFETVYLILSSSAETRGVDAFALSVIKAERQIRKLFTHLVYQFPAFGPLDLAGLRNTLAASRRVYFESFLAGFDALYPRSVEALVGQDYTRLKPRLDEAIDHRNKIFHGQLTSRGLTRQDLEALVADIQAWCTTLATNAFAELGYDGFGWNSLHKSKIPDLAARFKVQFTSLADYADFIRTKMERRVAEQAGPPGTPSLPSITRVVAGERQRSPDRTGRPRDVE